MTSAMGSITVQSYIHGAQDLQLSKVQCKTFHKHILKKKKKKKKKKKHIELLFILLHNFR